MPCFVLSYATRINAEQALSRGRQFKDKPLNVSYDEHLIDQCTKIA